MDRSLAWKIPVIFAVVIVGMLVVLNLPLRRGIDIAGGVSLVYEINAEEVPADRRTDLTDRTTSIVRKRLDPEGVRELTIRPMGQYGFEIQMPKMPGADDQDVAALVAEAKRKVGRPGRLEFRLLADENDERDAKATGRAPAGYKWFPVAPDAQSGNLAGRSSVLVKVEDDFNITGSYLRGVGRTTDDSGRRAIAFSFDDRGAKLFGRMTGLNRGKYLAIILDGQVQSAPVIEERIERHGRITGGGKGFSKEDQDELIAVLNAGSLDASLTLLSERVVGGQMGEENIQKAMKAIIVAGIIVLAFMAVYYLAAGLIADCALALNLVLVLAVMSLLEATLTLPGMAGLVLTVGMAVDANVLIFERIREEKRTHLALPLAIKNGYDRAFRTILDSNVTTLIAAATLFTVGSEAIKGFGITLSLGLLCSMFTALFVTRTIFNSLTGAQVLKGLPMLQIVKDPQVNFVRLRGPALIASGLAIVVGLFLFLRRPLSESLGTDFTGGTAVGFTVREPMKVADLKEQLRAAGFDRAKVQTVSRTGEGRLPLGVGQSFLVTVRETDSNLVRAQIYEALQAHLPKREVAFTATGTPIPLDAGGDTEQERTFAGGLKSVVTLDPPIARTDLDERLTAALAWAKDSQKTTLVKHAIESADTAVDGTVREFVLFTQESDPNIVDGVLNRAFTTSPFSEVTNFGRKVAQRMERDALVAISIALVLILIYVRVRFGGWLYGLGAIVALVHDVLVTLAFISLGYVLAPTALGQALLLEDFKIDLILIAAFLTIIGYSINDTIVVFDRIRENLGGRKDRRVTMGIVNDSVNQVLSRTLLTSLTTLVVVVTLYIFGGEGIHGFAYAMIVGVIVGTYSSIYIAPPFLLGFRLPETAAVEAAAGTGKTGRRGAAAKRP